MSDYQNNPIYDSDIRKLQGPTPSVVFGYEWDEESLKWVPARQPKIDLTNLDLDLDMNLENTDKILSGISGVLENLDVGVDFSQTNSWLSGISGVLEEQGQTNDEETHRILSGISGQLLGLNVDVDLTETNQKLVDIKDAVEDLEVEINVDNVQIDLVETNRILSGISGQDLTHYNENEKYLDGISGQDQTHYIENERLLKSLKDSAENISLSVEELKKNFADITYHIKRIGEDPDPGLNIEMENSGGIDTVRKPFSKILYNCVDQDETFDRENNHINKTKSIISESYPDDDNIERIGDHDESTPYLFKSEEYTGSLDGFHKFTPLAKPMGSDDRVTIFNDNEVPLEILFRGGDAMKLYGGYSMQLTKAEAYKMFVRKKYALNGFSLGYTLERMYTPEKTLLNDIEEHPQTLPENTHQLVTLGSFLTDEKHLYISYGNIIKRIAIASWEVISRPRSVVYPIDYYDAYADPSYLYLNFINSSKRVAIADWEHSSKIPIDTHNKVWADQNFIYVKIHGPKNFVGGYGGDDEWRRYAIAEY